MDIIELCALPLMQYVLDSYLPFNFYWDCTVAISSKENDVSLYDEQNTNFTKAKRCDLMKTRHGGMSN